ncbi:MAG TPA: mannose-1-phosphate guanylyltransferase [Rickettsia endosymbiont of Pyrocoelia pectoralis]|nr:mannose-1-phosphate guanylyltransferase [Rickettsia endosymbiont of Pyrocoelia pectoralis]
MEIKPVIIAGGTGKRLWPLSSENQPKQFKNLSGELTLLQQTLSRNKFLGKPTIITPKKYASITKRQAEEIGIEIELIIEPIQNNTAICAIITALSAEAQGFDLLVLLPSDHYVENEQNYHDTINTALNYVKNYGICTVGIPINGINTEYGYIKSGYPIAKNVYQLDYFVEKPTFEEAKKYFESNEYFWNSGIFIYDVSFFLSLAMSLQPELFEIAADAYNNSIKTENNIVLDCKKYNEAKSISIDHAIMEYICGMVMVEADFGWNDLGTWHSLLQVKQQGIGDNYCEGKVVTSNTTNSFISSNDKLTTVIGLDNVIVIDTVNGLLVADKSKTTEIQELIMKVARN